MKKSSFTDEQIVYALRQVEQGTTTVVVGVGVAVDVGIGPKKPILIVVSRGVELCWKAHDSHNAEKSPVHHQG